VEYATRVCSCNTGLECNFLSLVVSYAERHSCCVLLYGSVSNFDVNMSTLHKLFIIQVDLEAGRSFSG
jgi:hypothetical protein